MTSRKYDVIYKTVMADGAFTLMSDKQVIYIKIEAWWGKSAIEIQKVPEEVGSEYVLLLGKTIQQWVKYS